MPVLVVVLVVVLESDCRATGSEDEEDEDDQEEEKTMQVGFGREMISPKRGAPLIGYFAPRYNRGVLDDLWVKTVLFRDGRTIGGITSFDMCFMDTGLVDRFRRGLQKEGLAFGRNIIFCATHTHTGPYISDCWGAKADREYLRELVGKAVLSIRRAHANLHLSTLRCGSVFANDLAFNRRYWMKDGRVVTNPVKCDPDIVRPEGPVDRDIGVVAVEQDGRTVGMVANIVNHCDTTGGDLVSADWPGHMEKEIQRRLGYEIPVITLIGASGNINHFDVSTKRDQTSYREARRIGRGYAGTVLETVQKTRKVKTEPLRVKRKTVTIPYRTINEKEADEARRIVAIKAPPTDASMTSEDLAKGDSAVNRFFARQLLDFKKTCSGKKRLFDLVCIGFGKDLAIASLPGEPFTEIGLAIKKGSSFKKTFVASLAQGSCGYVPLKECFAQGGYEPLPVMKGGSAIDTAEKLIRCSLKMLQ